MTRIVRNVNPLTREKISNTMKNSTKSNETRKKISDAMKRYWSTIPTANVETRNDNTKNNKSKTTIPTL